MNKCIILSAFRKYTGTILPALQSSWVAHCDILWLVTCLHSLYQCSSKISFFLLCIGKNFPSSWFKETVVTWKLKLILEVQTNEVNWIKLKQVICFKHCDRNLKEIPLCVLLQCISGLGWMAHLKHLHDLWEIHWIFLGDLIHLCKGGKCHILPFYLAVWWMGVSLVKVQTVTFCHFIWLCEWMAFQ